MEAKQLRPQTQRFCPLLTSQFRLSVAWMWMLLIYKAWEFLEGALRYTQLVFGVLENAIEIQA